MIRPNASQKDKWFKELILSTYRYVLGIAERIGSSANSIKVRFIIMKYKLTLVNPSIQHSFAPPPV
jgi:hypothetical protein